MTEGTVVEVTEGEDMFEDEEDDLCSGELDGLVSEEEFVAVGDNGDDRDEGNGDKGDDIPEEVVENVDVLLLLSFTRDPSTLAIARTP